MLVSRVPAALAPTDDPGLKLAVFWTGPAIRNYGANLITEIIGTFMLVFGILAIVRYSGTPERSGSPASTGRSQWPCSCS